MITFTAAKTLVDVRETDRPTIGGKAFNCARLRQAGFPVPDGIVVPTDADDAAIRGLSSDPWFDNQPSDATYAVRSSGIDEDGVDHSFAGIHETHLNVPREQVGEAVLLCRRSGQSEQASAYRRSRNIAEGGAIGVLVQRMVPAQSSGVAFTINPISGDDELVINIAQGLGEALVSGQVDPDEFVVRKSDRTIVTSRRGGDSGMPVVRADQIDEIANALLAIETHYGAPQDVEFCHDGEGFWIVQSRPITASKQHSAPCTESERSRSGAGQPDIEWSRANLAEVFAEQMSPQVLPIYEQMLNNGQRRYMGRLLAPFDELGPMFRIFHGRMYMNLSQMRRVMSLAGAPAADMLRSIGHAEDIGPEDEGPVRPALRDILNALPDFVRLAINDARAASIFAEHERFTRAVVARFEEQPPASLSDREIWDSIQRWIGKGPDTIRAVFVMSGVMFRETKIKKVCEKVGFPYERLVYPQLAAGQRSVSSQQAVDLVALADVARAEPRAMRYLLENDGTFADRETALAGTRFLAGFRQFLEGYGHRGRYESDWALPRLSEDPAPALFAIREQLKNPPQDIAALTERQEAEAARAWREFESRLTWWQRWTLLPGIRAAVRRLKQQYVWREQVRSDLTRELGYARLLHLELAGRFVERGWIAQRDDYFLISLEEIAQVIEDPAKGWGLRGIADRQRARVASQRDLHLPLLARESELQRVTSTTESAISSDAELTGLCVSPGTIEAEVVVLRDPSEFAAMKAGAILVTRATDPSWTPLFTLASGVIVEVGGMLSHASTIAREYGLPALANVRHATRVLKTGDRITLDASGGRVVRKV